MTHDAPVRGVATSGWDGHSWSFGIADAVTVLAPTAAAADVAATLIANAVNVDHPAIDRCAASALDDHTDLEDRLVTTAVGAIGAAAASDALDAGAVVADGMLRRGEICGASLFLMGQTRVARQVDG